MTEKQCRDSLNLMIEEVLTSKVYEDYNIVMSGISTWKYPGEWWKWSMQINFYEK